MKYKKKPIVIEAFRFQIDDVMPELFHDKVITNEIITYADGTCDIHTLEGVMKAGKGDYIILGIKGEVYPCKPDIFEQTYEVSVDAIAPTTVTVSMDSNKAYESVVKGFRDTIRKGRVFNV